MPSAHELAAVETALELLAQYTRGAIGLWPDHARIIARFPLHSERSPNRIVHFSAGGIDFTHIPAQLAYLARQQHRLA